MTANKIDEHKQKNHTCCFTGHRPQKLHLPENEVRSLLKKAIQQAISDGFTIFISGVALGVDLWAAEIVLDEKTKNQDIQLWCASPYKGFELRWRESEQNSYNKIMETADYVKYVCKRYVPSCFQTRNIYMVDRSCRVIAAFNGEKGGTKNTIDYALKKDVEVINIFDK